MGLVGGTVMGLKLASKVTQRSRSIAAQWVSDSSRPLNGYGEEQMPPDAALTAARHDAGDHFHNPGAAGPVQLDVLRRGAYQQRCPLGVLI
jgi:hypothetical protein